MLQMKNVIYVMKIYFSIIKEGICHIIFKLDLHFDMIALHISSNIETIKAEDLQDNIEDV